MQARKIMLRFSLVVVGALFVYLGLPLILNNSSPQVATNSTGGAYESRIDDQAEVVVEVKPLKIDPNGQSQFEISLTTHSVELDDDLTKQAFLYDDQSHFIKPVSWDGSEPGGHHRDGVLTFGPFELPTKYVELKIKDIGDAPQRVFRWSL